MIVGFVKLELKNISLNIANKNIINNVNIKFENNLIYSLVGKSGTGKTSLLNIINFLYTPSSGKIIFDGKEVCITDETEIARLRCTEITYFQQDLSFIEGLTVLENLECFSKIKNVVFEKKDILRLAKKLDILDILDQNVSVLSGGERQRAAFLKLLFLPSSLILIDEPTNNLDRENMNIILDSIKLLKDMRKTIIVVSHSEEVEKIADVCFKMENINEK
ncbi:MAG: ATP-binding cassette domain-containing protein [Erysipelotrichaceae bacterium]